ncbi:MAG: single-stranded DNA-binding protein [Oligoflexia bacterium]|nr:single-stranded DNA-binding protein [Oligoflexia bacterium]
MRGINKVTVCGHLGHNPELKTTPTGKVVCDLRIATNHSRKKGDEWIEETEWHRVTLWEQQAEVALRCLHKGSTALVEGRLKTDSWDDKETGKRRYRTRIVCEKLHLVDSRRDWNRDKDGDANVPNSSQYSPQHSRRCPPSRPPSDRCLLVVGLALASRVGPTRVRRTSRRSPPHSAGRPPAASASRWV